MRDPSKARIALIFWNSYEYEYMNWNFLTVLCGLSVDV